MRGLFAWVIVTALLMLTGPAYGQFTSVGLESRAIQEMQVQGDYLYAGTDQGFYRLDLSTAGSDWEDLGFDARVSSFVVFSKDTMLVGLGESPPLDSVYLYKTINGGSSWDIQRDGPGSDSTDRSIVDLDWAGSGNYTMFAVTHTGIYRSPNRGDSWNRLSLNSEIATKSQRSQSEHGAFEFRFVNAVYGADPAVLTGGQNGFGYGTLLYSRDAGETWLGNSFSDESFSGADQNLRYANDAIMPSKDSELTFAAVGSHVQKSSRMFLGGLYLKTELYHGQYEFLDLAVSGDYTDAIYAGGDNARQGMILFKSSDGGNHWNMYRDTTAQTSRINALAVSENQENRVYMGTNAGVYRLNDDAQSVPADKKPTVEITAPADSSKRFYIDSTNSYYRGVEVHFSGSDPDGQVEEYGWALGDQPYTWTTDSVITIDNETFGSTGTYTLRATVRDDDSLRASADTVQFELIKPSLNQGVLVVDGTNEKDFQRVSHLGQLTDSYIDSSYENWMRPLEVTHWDIQDDGLPPHRVVGKYSLVYWHADNWYGNSKTWHEFGAHRSTSVLSDYMGAGGDFILSGWKVLMSIYPGNHAPLTLDSLDFARRYLKVHRIEDATSEPPGAFVGAHGVNEGYSDVIIDSSRVKGYPAGFFDNMIDVHPIQSTADNTDSIYTFRCREECNNTEHEGKVVGQITQNRIYNTAVLGFPLTFIRESDAAGTVHQMLDDFGYEVTSTPKTQQPERFSLKNNYPNPFNPTTNIKFSLPKAASVQLTVYNTIGQRVATLVNSKMTAGNHSVTFDGTGLTSGVYIYRLKAGEHSQTRKMLLVK